MIQRAGPVRRAIVVAIAAVAATVAVPLSAAPSRAAGPPGARTAYQLPLPGASVQRGFDVSGGPFAAGHRGVDLDASPGLVVRAAAEGVVSFAGLVAGRGVVVVTHPDGIRTTYEPVAASVAVAAVVGIGDRIGAVDGAHGEFGPGAVLHWGARRGATYLDPMTLLRPLGPVRLVPV